MRGLVVLAALAVAACAEDQSYLNRWDDPRVIQVIGGRSHSSCHEEAFALRGADVIANFERMEWAPHCIWYDGLVRFQRHEEGFRFLVAAKSDREPYSCLLIAHHRPEVACQPLAPIAVDLLSEAGAEVVRMLNPDDGNAEDLCFSVSVDQSLAVSEVFAMRNQLLAEGVTCLMVIQELAITTEGGRFPERP